MTYQSLSGGASCVAFPYRCRCDAVSWSCCCSSGDDAYWRTMKMTCACLTMKMRIFCGGCRVWMRNVSCGCCYYCDVCCCCCGACYCYCCAAFQDCDALSACAWISLGLPLQFPSHDYDQLQTNHTMLRQIPIIDI